MFDEQPNLSRDDREAPNAEEAAPSGPLRTNVGKAWLIKTALVLLVLFGLGLWGVYDAFYLYPARGRLDEQFVRRDYLQAAVDAFPPPQTSVEDPKAELSRLKSNESLDAVEQARLTWLVSLSRISSLGAIAAANRKELDRRAADPSSPPQATATLFVDPRAELAQLTQTLATKPQPKPLSSYDLPLQYAFVVVGLGGGLAMLVFASGVVRKTYRYEPAEKRLTLPSGKSFKPENIEDVDKRKWDKFLVFLTLDDGSPELKLDLYRYQPLEEWILEMEKLSPNYEPPPEDDEDESEGAEASADAADEGARA